MKYYKLSIPEAGIALEHIEMAYVLVTKQQANNKIIPEGMEWWGKGFNFTLEDIPTDWLQETTDRKPSLI